MAADSLLASAVIIMAALCIASTGRKGGPEMGFHPGLHFFPVDSQLLRGYINVNYVLNVANIEVGNVNTTSPRICMQKKNDEKSRRMSIPCEAMDKSNLLLIELTKSVRHLLASVNILEPSARKNKRSLFDSIMRTFFNVASESDLRKVETTEKDMVERMKEVKFFMEMKGLDAREMASNLNEWSGNLTEVYGNAFRHVDGLQHVLEDEENVDRAILAFTSKLAVGSLAELLTITHFMQERLILSDCERGKIPVQAVNLTQFQTKLRDLSDQLKGDGIMLTVDPEDIMSYTHLKLATCKRSKTRLLITLAVPVMFMTDQQSKVYHVQPLDFVFNGEQCKLAGDEAIVIWNSITSKALVLSREVSQTCISDKLCLIPRVNSNHELSTCFSAVMRGDELEMLRKVCVFICDKKEPKTRISFIGENMYSVSSLAKSLTLQCRDTKKTILISGNGAVTIKVECDCKLLQDDEILIERSIPCQPNSNNSETVKYILPSLWAQEDVPPFDLGEINQPSFKKNVSDVLDVDWKSKIPHLKVPEAAPALPETIWSEPDIPMHAGAWGFKIFLAVLIIWLFIKVYRVAKAFYVLRHGITRAMHRDQDHMEMDRMTS